MTKLALFTRPDNAPIYVDIEKVLIVEPLRENTRIWLGEGHYVDVTEPPDKVADKSKGE